MTTSTRWTARPLLPCVAVGLLLLAGCTFESRDAVAPTGGGASTSAPPATTDTPGATPTPSASASSAPPSISPVLPVKDNPMTSTGTAKVLAIDSVLVENNELPNGDDAPDHLEVALRNTGSQPLSGVEVFYTFADPKTGDRESYYVRLPDSFTIAAGGRRVAHFDGTKAKDHFPVNRFSLYHSTTNALDVTVQVAASDAAPVTGKAAKDAGGAEEAD